MALSPTVHLWSHFVICLHHRASFHLWDQLPASLLQTHTSLTDSDSSLPHDRHFLFYRLTTLIIRQSLFRCRLETSFSTNPSHHSLLFLLQDWLHGFPRLLLVPLSISVCTFHFPLFSFRFCAVDSADLCQLLSTHSNSISYRTSLVYVCYYFTSAAVAVDSSHMTASSSTSWSRFSPPSNFVNGHVYVCWLTGPVIVHTEHGISAGQLWGAVQSDKCTGEEVESSVSCQYYIMVSGTPGNLLRRWNCCWKYWKSPGT